MLDSRGPPSQYVEEEKVREERTEKEIQRLIKDARLWRVANSAQWVAWGIVQAKVPGMDEALEKLQEEPVLGPNNKPSQSSHHGEKLQSDPLSPEIAALAASAHDKRPESRVEEETAMEGEDRRDAEEHEEFDYLAYAQERAMFFWGDVLTLGLVKEEELPKEMLRKVKVVPY